MVGEVDSEGHDHGLELTSEQNDLINAVVDANHRTVVVLKTGSAILMPWIDRVPAILEAWYPGEEDGNAVADVLFGITNPSGRLPLTFPKRLEDLPAHTPEQYPGVNGLAKYSEGVFVGYRYYDAHNIAPLFPFGYGLSYTTFRYANLKLSPVHAQDSGYDPAFTVEFDITNSGSRAGAEVGQVYVGLPSTSAVAEPPKQLAGFARVELKAGEKKRVSIPIEGRSLSYWDVGSHDWKLVHGAVQVMVGASSRDIQLQGRVTLP
jgi:beta-glucosidase